MKKRVKQRMNVRMNEAKYRWKDRLKKGRMKQMNEWMDEREEWMNGLVPGASFTDLVRGELESLVFRTMTRVQQGLIIHR